MLNIRYLIVLFAYHFAADFYFQTEYQAQNKWHSLKALLSHTVVYSATFYFAFGWRFCLVTFLCHTLTDFFTSKLNHKLAVKALVTGKWHNFFLSVGFDQLLHQIQLLVTFAFLGGLK